MKKYLLALLSLIYLISCNTEKLAISRRTSSGESSGSKSKLTSINDITNYQQCSICGRTPIGQCADQSENEGNDTAPDGDQPPVTNNQTQVVTQGTPVSSGSQSTPIDGTGFALSFSARGTLATDLVDGVVHVFKCAKLWGKSVWKLSDEAWEAAELAFRNSDEFVEYGELLGEAMCNHVSGRGKAVAMVNRLKALAEVLLDKILALKKGGLKTEADQALFSIYREVLIKLDCKMTELYNATSNEIVHRIIIELGQKIQAAIRITS